MKILRKLITIVLILALANIAYIGLLTPISSSFYITLVVVSVLFWIIYNIIPGHISGTVPKGMNIKMQALYGGAEMIMIAAICSILEVAIILSIVFWTPWKASAVNIVIAFVVLELMIIQGIVRIIVFSKQAKLGWKLLVILFWWVPIVNVVIIAKVCRIARMECERETHLRLMDIARAENHICKTKYPIMMVHGIFFRDWQYFNYWGRIPEELFKNGADVHYGRQQSSLTIANSAQELSEQIKEIIAETGCEKLNIIAHSKGGLDARYAISCLECAPHVASLTTINTPHHGCDWVDVVLEKSPQKLIRYIERKYNQIFRKLGDDNPDFMGGVTDLTGASAKEFNSKVLNCEGILYQSVMSQMSKARSAGFPLNIGYRVIKKVQKTPNDGLVPIESAKWGHDLGLIKASGRRGISHADMIDLNRENIPGFKVRDFYIDLIADLKDKGL